VIAPPRAPRRTIRLRLTLVYAALFLVSGAVLLTITYLVVAHSAPGPELLSFRGNGAAAEQAGGPVVIGGSRSGGGAANSGAANSGAANIGPANSGAANSGVCITTKTTALPEPGQLPACVAYLEMRATALRTGYQDTQLITSGIALGVMTIVALGLGWLVSGRVLRPLRTITVAARSISARNLHQRLALQGPDDELKELGDTIDGLLARLECSFAAQRQFVANASHELRTPLARQRTLVEVALADPDRSVESLTAACERVLAAGQQQERLIEALLTLARSQRGLDHYERVDLAGLAREVTDARVAEAQHHGVELAARADGTALVAGDLRLAERLITNLVDNAIRHNMAGGSVTVSVSADQDPGGCTLVVANTGPVINPGDVGGLFEPFRRGGQRRTGDGDSPGLGLSIVGAIAAAHAAALSVTPRAGGGLEVRVGFPRLPGQARPVAMSPAMASVRAG
jgi:signal transduction histidine kinase